jgi:hypothetical protein
MHSLLAHVDKGDVAADPFPHITVADALNDDLCDRLQSEFPRLEQMTAGEVLPSRSTV